MCLSYFILKFEHHSFIGLILRGCFSDEVKYSCLQLIVNLRLELLDVVLVALKRFALLLDS